MSEVAWMCRNPECGLMFQWNRGINMAIYSSGDETLNKYVPGGTRPDGCPECGQEKVDALEG